MPPFLAKSESQRFEHHPCGAGERTSVIRIAVTVRGSSRDRYVFPPVFVLAQFFSDRLIGDKEQTRVRNPEFTGNSGQIESGLRNVAHNQPDAVWKTDASAQKQIADFPVILVNGDDNQISLTHQMPCTPVLIVFTVQTLNVSEFFEIVRKKLHA